MKLLIVLGEGGHTKQMLNLVSLLMDSDQDTYELHYVVSREDELSIGHIAHPGPVHRITRPRGKSTGKLGAALGTLRAGIQSIDIVRRVRPAAVISAGPAIAVPVSLAGKLLGARIVFIESSSRITRPSLTGRIMYRWADLFFVQWQQLQARFPRAIFAGRLV
jgi:UDP-N-acetylglucosamine:LPS N-acetylglucosamine transferase